MQVDAYVRSPHGSNFLFIVMLSFIHYPVMIFHFRCNMCKIFAEGNFLRRKFDSGSEVIATASMPKDIHGAPPESLVVKLAEVIGSFRTLKKMTLFWCSVVSEVSYGQSLRYLK